MVVSHTHEGLDPPRLAERQIEIDIERTRGFPALLDRKHARMCASPLAFLRGSCPLFYEMLAARPDLADGPDGSGNLVGDLHIENFGAYEPGPYADDVRHPAIFDLNDFDDATRGPFRLDVIRLLTSLVVGSRELGTTGIESMELAEVLLAAYVDAAFHGAFPKTLPHPVAGLIERASRRTFRQLAKVFVDAKTHRFHATSRLVALAPEIANEVEPALMRYRERLEGARPKKAHLRVIDAAWRVAGTGSLGALRIAVLVKGKDTPFLIDMKAQGAPSSEGLGIGSDLAPNARVVEGFKACIATPSVLLGTTQLAEHSMVVRKLAEEEDKLDLTRIRRPDLPPLAAHLGALLGRAHARGQDEGATIAPWSRGDQRHLLEHAIDLAGIHEALYLAFSRAKQRF